jgi:hypothetical protein
MAKTKTDPHEEMLRMESHLLRLDRDKWRSLAIVLADALRAQTTAAARGDGTIPRATVALFRYTAACKEG